MTVLPAPQPVAVWLADERRQSKAVGLAALALSQRGYCVCRGCLGNEVVADAGREVSKLFKHGAMKPGGFTVQGQDVVKARRDDHTLWLHEYLTAVGGPERGGTPTLLALDQALHAFAEAVIDALTALERPNEPLGRAADGGKLHYTGRTDLMVACYPGGGAHYGPHVDNVDGDGRDALDFGRCFTLVYYLNEAKWEDAKGGALRVHLAPSSGDSSKLGGGGWHALTASAAAAVREPHDAVDIAPSGDTLVLFRADRMLHEVRPAFAPRLAATMWLYGGTEAQSARERGRPPSAGAGGGGGRGRGRKGSH